MDVCPSLRWVHSCRTCRNGNYRSLLPFRLDRSHIRRNGRRRAQVCRRRTCRPCKSSGRILACRSGTLSRRVGPYHRSVRMRLAPLRAGRFHASRARRGIDDTGSISRSISPLSNSRAHSDRNPGGRPSQGRRLEGPCDTLWER